MICHNLDQVRAAGEAIAATFPPLTDEKVAELARILAPIADMPSRRDAQAATTRTSAPASRGEAA